MSIPIRSPILLVAALALGGCGAFVDTGTNMSMRTTTLPGTVGYRIEPDVDGRHAALICNESSSGTCHFQLGEAGAAVAHPVASGARQRIELPAQAVGLCVSASVRNWPGCGKAELTPQGAIVTRL